MKPSRQTFQRLGPDARRHALIDACARVLATKGASGASVRAICAEAGVSPGLLTHYFSGVSALVAATYEATGGAVDAALEAAVNGAESPSARLIAYLTASFRAPISDPALLATWLAFWSLARTDPAIAALHTRIYGGYRMRLEQLIADCVPGDQRLAAIGLTALVDGLWLELSLGDAPFSADDAAAIVAHWVELSGI